MSISKEVIEIINASVNKAVKVSVKAIEERNKSEINYFKKTEKLLYNYPRLKRLIDDSDKDIENMREEGYAERSKDIVGGFHGGSEEKIDRLEIQEERIQNRLDSLERTRCDIRWIERALDDVRDDPWYPVIELKYFDGMEMKDIAEKVHTSESTAKRWKNRLVENIGIGLFGSDVLNIK